MKLIKSITPIDYYELIIEFENGEFKYFSSEKLKAYEQHDFLAYPNKLKSFKYDQITWFNKISFDKEYLYKIQILAQQELERKALSISSKNLKRQLRSTQLIMNIILWFTLLKMKNSLYLVNLLAVDMEKWADVDLLT